MSGGPGFWPPRLLSSNRRIPRYPQPSGGVGFEFPDGRRPGVARSRGRVAGAVAGVELPGPPADPAEAAALLGGEHGRVEEDLVVPDGDVVGQRQLRLLESALVAAVV